MKTVIINSTAGPVIQDVSGDELLYLGGTSYLGLNIEPEISDCLISGVKKWGFGAGASRVTSGETLAYQNLERHIGSLYSDRPSVIVPSTIIASFIMLDSLKKKYDFFVYDECAHPSIKAAILSTGMPNYKYTSNNPEHAYDIIRRESKRKRKGVICTDSVNAVDGTAFSLVQLYEISEITGSQLFVDDAHGFGVLGDGRGALHEVGLAEKNIAYVASFSKALGAFGGFLSNKNIGAAVLKKSPFFTTSTPFPSFIAEAISYGLDIGIKDSKRRLVLNSLSKRLKSGLNNMGLDCGISIMPYLAFSVGKYENNKNLSDDLRKEGIWIPLIRYPSPTSDGVFRMSVSAAHSEDQLDHALSILKKLL